jgi:hypothetical protein
LSRYNRQLSLALFFHNHIAKLAWKYNTCSLHGWKKIFIIHPKIFDSFNHLSIKLLEISTTKQPLVFFFFWMKILRNQRTYPITIFLNFRDDRFLSAQLIFPTTKCQCLCTMVLGGKEPCHVTYHLWWLWTWFLNL